MDGYGNSTAAKWKNGLPNGDRALPDRVNWYTGNVRKVCGWDEKKKTERQTITVVVNGKSVPVTMHPPVPPRTSWYAFWHGLMTSRSTGQSDYEEAVRVVQDMLGNGGESGQPWQMRPSRMRNVRRFNAGISIVRPTNPQSDGP